LILAEFVPGATSEYPRRRSCPPRARSGTVATGASSRQQNCSSSDRAARAEAATYTTFQHDPQATTLPFSRKIPQTTTTSTRPSHGPCLPHHSPMPALPPSSPFAANPTKSPSKIPPLTVLPSTADAPATQTVHPRPTLVAPHPRWANQSRSVQRDPPQTRRWTNSSQPAYVGHRWSADSPLRRHSTPKFARSSS
jgi:hypothetical protein